MNLKNMFWMIAVVFIMASCQKELNAPKLNGNLDVKANSVRDIKVPAGFQWNTTREIQVKVQLTESSFGSLYHKVEVFSDDPAKGGRKLAQGSVSMQEAFATKLTIPTAWKEVFIVKTAPDNSTQSRLVTASDKIELALGNKPLQKMGKSAGPDCSSGCTSTISMTSNRTVSSGTVCITNNTISGNLTISGSATVRICGSGTIAQLTVSSGSTLIIASGANVNFSEKVTSYGTFTNYGTITTVAKDLEVNTGTFTNNGTVNVGNDLKVTQNGTLVNNGTIIVENDHQTDKGNTTNNCYMLVKHSFEINGTDVANPVFANNGYLRVNSNSNINDKASMTISTGAMFRTTTLQLQVGKIIGDNVSGQNALVKVVSTASLNSAGRISGSVQYCANSTAPSGVLTSGAAAGCNLYIPTSACNPDGNGSVVVTDTDGDGVSDTNDDYPNDATKAYDNSVLVQTLAFEDLWPSTGDYDLNDVVMEYSANVVTNASNIVVRVEAHYELKATGGSFQNGFAVQFPIARNKVSGLSGATLEAGQTNAVVVLFNNMRNEAANWNTITGNPTTDPIPYVVTFNVSNGPSLATFGLGVYNPFIWNNSPGFGRGYEVHMPGKLPTDLANPALFGSISDATNLNSGDTYVSKNGRLPWAIAVPYTFNYPKETIDITQAYTHFASWAASGGTNYSDWYANTSGYRNANAIY